MPAGGDVSRLSVSRARADAVCAARSYFYEKNRSIPPPPISAHHSRVCTHRTFIACAIPRASALGRPMQTVLPRAGARSQHRAQCAFMLRRPMHTLDATGRSASKHRWHSPAFAPDHAMQCLERHAGHRHAEALGATRGWRGSAIAAATPTSSGARRLEQAQQCVPQPAPPTPAAQPHPLRMQLRRVRRLLP